MPRAGNPIFSILFLQHFLEDALDYDEMNEDTPYFGLFICRNNSCNHRQWFSARAFLDMWQKCHNCNDRIWADNYVRIEYRPE